MPAGRPGTTRARVLAALAPAGHWRTSHAIVAASGCDRQQVYNVLRQLTQEGVLRRRLWPTKYRYALNEEV